MLVQVLFIFYGLPQLLGGPIDALTAGIAAIAVNSGAYISEIVRGGVQSIERGQREAGLSLGLSRSQTFRYMIWPQGFRRMIPALGNQGDHQHQGHLALRRDRRGRAGAAGADLHRHHLQRA